MFGDHNISEERTLTNFFVYLALGNVTTDYFIIISHAVCVLTSKFQLLQKTD